MSKKKSLKTIFWDNIFAVVVATTATMILLAFGTRATSESYKVREEVLKNREATVVHFDEFRKRQQDNNRIIRENNALLKAGCAQ